MLTTYNKVDIIIQHKILIKIKTETGRKKGVHRKRCSENMQHVYRKCDFNKVALH